MLLHSFVDTQSDITKYVTNEKVGVIVVESVQFGHLQKLTQCAPFPLSERMFFLDIVR